MKKKIISLILSLCMITSLFIPFEVSAEEDPNSVIVDVTDYGADPSGATDSAEAVQAAIAKAKELSDSGKSVIINFPTGRYDIYPDKSPKRELYISNTVGTNSNYKIKTIGVLLEDMDNITVEGNNSLFMFHGKMTSFVALNCQNVKFQNFKMDYQVHTVIDVTVESISGNNVVYYIPECYDYSVNGNSITFMSDISPYTGQRYWSITNAPVYTQRYDSVQGLTYRSNTGTNYMFSNITSIQDLGNGRVQITHSSVNSELKVGLSYQMRLTVRDHSGIFICNCKDVVMENINVRFLHGFGLVCQTSENFTLNNVDFQVDRSSGTTTASYADFVQVSGCKGLIDIGNCYFSNPHDDPINIHGTFLQVVEKVASNKVKVRFMHNETAGFQNYFVGDQVEFFVKSNLLPVENSVATITAVDGPDGKGGVVGEGSGSLTDIILTLDRDIPSEVEVNKHVVENITYTPNVHIHDNIFRENPTRGILCTTRGEVVIENNFFDGMGMAGIYISDDAQSWYESGNCRNVTIRNNTFTRGKAQAIFIEPTNPVVSTDKTVHSNITIEGNVFFTDNLTVLDAKSVKDLTFKNNKIYRLTPNVNVTATANKTSLNVGESATITASATGSSLSNKVYKFNGCKNVIISGNTYDAGINTGIAYSNMQSSDITVTDNAVVGSNNTSNAGGVVTYESSNTNVVTVSQTGAVTTVGNGSAIVSVYSLSGDRKLGEQLITFNVGGSTQIAEDNFTIKSANTKLATATVTGLSKKFADFTQGTDYYYTTANVSESNITFNFAAEDTNATTRVLVNGEETQTSGTANLINGINIIEVRVTAEDGVTFRDYRFIILKTTNITSTLSTLAVNGNNIELQEGVFEYKYSLDSNSGSNTITATTTDLNTTVAISQDGNIITDNRIDLKAGFNQIYVVVTPQNGDSPSRYVLNVKLPDATSAYLESAAFGDKVTLNEAFSRDNTNYTGNVFESTVNYSFVADEQNSKISVTINGTRVINYTGSANGICNLKNGNNTITVTVTSPDTANTKVYTYSLYGAAMVYISDLEYESNSTIGWGTIHKDAEVEGTPITLRDNNGANVVFSKGIGTHADSDIYYNIANKGYTKFESYVGVDASKTDYGSITFEVLIDGVSKYRTEELTITSAMHKISVDIPADAQIIQLRASKGTNDWSDHADWADAKFLSNFVEASQSLMGDVNNDGILDGLDVTNILKHIVRISVDNFDTTLADFNQDGSINVKDVTKLQKNIIGL